MVCNESLNELGLFSLKKTGFAGKKSNREREKREMS